MKRFLQLAVSLVFGALLLWLAFRHVDLQVALQHLLSISWYNYLAFLGCLLLTHILRTQRYRLQMSCTTGGPVPFWESLGVMSVAIAATFLFPFRLGEFVRPYLIKTQGYMSMSRGLSTVAAERVIDGLTTTAMLGVVLFLLRDTALPNEIFIGGYVAVAVFGSAGLVFVVGYWQRQWTVNTIHKLAAIVSVKVADKVAAIADHFIAGLNTLPRWQDLVLYELYTIAYWLVNGGSMYLLMTFIGFDPGLTAGYLALGCLVIGVMIPAPPGSVGNFEYAIVLPLTALGVGNDLAAAYAVALHLLHVLQMTGMAGIFLLSGKISLRRVMEATRADGQGEQPTA